MILSLCRRATSSTGSMWTGSPYDRRRALDDGVGGKDHLVSRTDAQRGNGDVERHRAVHNRNSVTLPAHRRHTLFELAHERARGRNPPGFNAFGEVLRLIAVEQRLIDGDHRKKRSDPCSVNENNVA